MEVQGPDGFTWGEPAEPAWGSSHTHLHPSRGGLPSQGRAGKLGQGPTLRVLCLCSDSIRGTPSGIPHASPQAAPRVESLHRGGVAPKPKMFTRGLFTESACQACSRTIVSAAPRTHCLWFPTRPQLRTIIRTSVAAVLAPRVRRQVGPPLGFGPWSTWPRGTL